MDYEERLQDPSLLADSIPLGNISVATDYLLFLSVETESLELLDARKVSIKKTAQEISEKSKR